MDTGQPYVQVESRSDNAATNNDQRQQSAKSLGNKTDAHQLKLPGYEDVPSRPSTRHRRHTPNALTIAGSFRDPLLEIYLRRLRAHGAVGNIRRRTKYRRRPGIEKRRHPCRWRISAGWRRSSKLRRLCPDAGRGPIRVAGASRIARVSRSPQLVLLFDSSDNWRTRECITRTRWCRRCRGAIRTHADLHSR